VDDALTFLVALVMDLVNGGAYRVESMKGGTAEVIPELEGSIVVSVA
jgi:hypothetical protein